MTESLDRLFNGLPERLTVAQLTKVLGLSSTTVTLACTSGRSRCNASAAARSEASARPTCWSSLCAGITTATWLIPFRAVTGSASG